MLQQGAKNEQINIHGFMENPPALSLECTLFIEEEKTNSIWHSCKWPNDVGK